MTKIRGLSTWVKEIFRQLWVLASQLEKLTLRRPPKKYAAGKEAEKEEEQRLESLQMFRFRARETAGYGERS